MIAQTPDWVLWLLILSVALLMLSLYDLTTPIEDPEDD